MPTAANFTFAFSWSEMIGAFNALIAAVNAPIAIGVALTLASGAAAFVVTNVRNNARKPKRQRRQRLKASSRLPNARTPADLDLPDLVIPAASPDAETITNIRPTSDDPVEQAILDRLADGGPAHIDEIGRELDLPAHQVSAAVTMLELKGDIQNQGGMNYSLSNQQTGEAAPQADLVKETPTGGQLSVTNNQKPTESALDTPARAQKRGYHRLLDWLQRIFANIFGERKKRPRPNPDLVRPFYMPEIEYPPAKEYAPPLLDDLLAEIEEDAPDIMMRLKTERPQPNRGQITRVFGADPSRQYDLQYDVVELSDLITSNTDSGAINPAYPAELQPRDRTRTASAMQVDHIAQSLEPDALLSEFLALDRGAPIIGDDNAVESGNGRVMALRRAADRYPDRFEDYRQRLSAIAEDRGLNPNRLTDYDRPVLVRRLVSDDVDRAAFAEEANSAAILQMSETERARNDARRISPEALYALEVGDDFDRSLRSSRNRDFIRSFVAQLPENDRAAMIDRDGDLTQSGIRRVKAALFNRVYDDPKLSDRLFESTDNDVKNVTNGLMGSLGRLAQAEELVRQGQRNQDLSVAPDIAIATEKLSSLKDMGIDVDTYLAQGQLFERELTPVQEKILVAFNERRRSGKKIRELVSSWADYVEAQPDPNQLGFFGDISDAKADLVDRWLNAPTGQAVMELV